MERGREICKTLKEVRRDIARANDIPYEPAECHHQGDCMGTCPKCEQEVRYIEDQLSMRRALGKAVSVVGISVGLAALSSCGKVLNIFSTSGYLVENDTVCHMPETPLDQEDSTTTAQAPKTMVVNTDTMKENMLLGDIIEAQPSFPGGQTQMLEFISKEVKYPQAAKKDSIEGRVVVSFIVEKDGSINKAKVEKPVHPLLDEEALRVINAMPKWIPGMLNGKAIRVKYNVPITFKM